ncbi:hypothetical protein ACVNP1_01680 [Staphylococcus aureus]
MQRCIWQERPTQFGISEDEVDDVIEAALAMPNIHLDGFHFHSISNNLDSNLHVDVVKLYFKKAKSWSEKQSHFHSNISILVVV